MLAVHFASLPVSHASSHSNNNNDYDMHGAIASSVSVTFVRSSLMKMSFDDFDCYKQTLTQCLNDIGQTLSPVDTFFADSVAFQN